MYVDTPLLLDSDAKASWALGMERFDGISRATLTMYGISLGFIPVHIGIAISQMSVAGFVATGIIGGLLYMTTRILSLVVGCRAFENARKARVAMLPFAAPAVGGAVAGLGGTF